MGHGLSLNEARFGIWENDVTVIFEIDGADLDVLVKRGNPTCEDVGQGGPMLNYLRFLAVEVNVPSPPTPKSPATLLCHAKPAMRPGKNR